MIRVENVTKTYTSSGQVTRIGPVSLELGAGGLTAFIGPNGAGKSTLLTMIGRLLEPDSGRITVGGLDVARAVEMMRLLRRAATDLGRTVLIVLHDVNIAARYADRIVAMKDGAIACDGTPEQIMRDQVLTDVFGTEITVVKGPDGPLACYR